MVDVGDDWGGGLLLDLERGGVRCCNLGIL